MSSICHVCGGGGTCPLCDGTGHDTPTEARSFGSVVLDLMYAREMSQVQLAWLMDGYQPASLSRVINGRRGPSAEAVGKLAQALALDPHEAELLFLAAGYATERTQARARKYLSRGSNTGPWRMRSVGARAKA